MSKTKVLAVLMVLVAAPMVMFADARQHIDRLELGASAGVGFYVGQKNPVAGSELLRVQSYDAIAFGEQPTLRWPGIETFGFNVGYRIDTRWTVVAQTVRQRLCFAEYYRMGETDQVRGVYYNAMWHLDVMAEYNLLNFGNVMMPKQGVFNVVPYVGLGLGVTMFNENATLRSVNARHNNDPKMNTFYPQVGTAHVNGESTIGGNEIGVSMYVPVACGIKWRINDNVQLKAAFQYQLHFGSPTKGKGLSSNLEGATYADYKDMQNRPKFEELDKQVVGKNHNCLFSVSAIFNFGKWYEDRLITY